MCNIARFSRMRKKTQKMRSHGENPRANEEKDKRNKIHKIHSRPKSRTRDRTQRDGSKHIKDNARSAAVHDAVIVAHIGADEQPGGARRLDARVWGWSPRHTRDVAVVVGRWSDGGIQHGAVFHGCVVKGWAYAGLDELVAVSPVMGEVWLATMHIIRVWLCL